MSAKPSTCRAKDGTYFLSHGHPAAWLAKNLGGDKNRNDISSDADAFGLLREAIQYVPNIDTGQRKSPEFNKNEIR